MPQTHYISQADDECVLASWAILEGLTQQQYDRFRRMIPCWQTRWNAVISAANGTLKAFWLADGFKALRCENALGAIAWAPPARPPRGRGIAIVNLHDLDEAVTHAVAYIDGRIYDPELEEYQQGLVWAEYKREHGALLVSIIPKEPPASC